jgi:ribosomal protein S18 acetylase RimI-like enzyme
VIVGEKDGRLLGFVTCKIDRRSRPLLGLSVGTIVLVAVDEKGRGKGVASTMTAGALDWFRENGTDLVEVGTQLRNMQASRLYETSGFRLVASSLSMRRWVR